MEKVIIDHAEMISLGLMHPYELDDAKIHKSVAITPTAPPSVIETARVAYQLFEDDLAAFIEWFLQDIITTKEIPAFHREIFETLKTQNRIALAAPRGFAKSTIVTKIYPLHAALFKKHRDICIISASENLASEHLRFIKRELEVNTKIKACWGDVRSEKWNETHMAVTHRDGFVCNIRAKGAGGQIRGFRPDCIVLDDIETDDGVESEDQRKKLKGWIFKACLNTLMPGGKFCIIGTLMHPLSVLNDILTIPNGWFKKKYQAYRDGMEAPGYELWPAMWSHEMLQARKLEIGSFAFASEYMNDPSSDGSSPIQERHIRYYGELPKTLSCVICVDPAYSDDESADYKVVCCVGIDQDQNRYLLDYIRTHAPSGEFQDAILNMYLRYKNMCTALGCPKSGGDHEFYNGLTRLADQRRIYPPFVELKNLFRTASGTDIRNKKGRITAALQPLFEKGKYYIHPDHLEAREELLTIGSSRHDDLCFVRGTMIATLFGDVPIERIKNGDMVLTPQGIQRVTASRSTGIREVVDNIGLCGTPDHPVFSSIKGFASMDSLGYNELSKLNLKEIIRWRYQKLLYLMEKNTKEWVEREDIIYLHQILIKEERVLRDFTWRFGNFITNKKFLKAIIFTIKTAIHLTTTLAIYNVYRLANIIISLKTIIKLQWKNTYQILDTWLLSGINLQKELSGIGRMGKIGLLNIKNYSVYVVRRFLSQNIATLNYVQQPVSRSYPEIVEDGTRIENVVNAGTYSELTNTARREHVVRNANTNTSRKLEEVYNITVENENVYYANGVLVSNCDCLSYAENILTPLYYDTNNKKDDDWGMEREPVHWAGKSSAYGMDDI